MTEPDIVETVAQRFVDANAAAIDLDGERLHRALVLEVGARTHVRVEQLSVEDPDHFVVLSLIHGVLEVADTAASQVRLRATTSPNPTTLVVNGDGDGDASLLLWTGWREDGVDQSWLGDAGFIVEDATGEPDAGRTVVDALVVRSRRASTRDEGNPFTDYVVKVVLTDESD